MCEPVLLFQEECVNQGRSLVKAGWTGEGLLEVVNPGVTVEVTA